MGLRLLENQIRMRKSRLTALAVMILLNIIAYSLFIFTATRYDHGDKPNKYHRER